MDDEAQARAYAEADFEDAHESFVDHFRRVFGDKSAGQFALDLGCGPGDIAIRFARAHPSCTVHGVDGSEAMLLCGKKYLAAARDVSARVQLIHGMLPGALLPRAKYDTIISNSLLHHLPDPQVLWSTIRRHAVTGAPIFVMDLVRPSSVERAKELVSMHVRDEPEILRRDFFNSLLAAFDLDEVRSQLDEAGLAKFVIEQISDRHLIVAGRAP